MARCASRAAGLRVAHAALLQLPRQFEPPTDPTGPTDATEPTSELPSGTAVRTRVEASLDELTARCHDGHRDEIAAWLRPKVEPWGAGLRRLMLNPGAVGHSRWTDHPHASYVLYDSSDGGSFAYRRLGLTRWT